MNDYIAFSAYFGAALTLIIYVVSFRISDRIGHPLANPILICLALLIFSLVERAARLAIAPALVLAGLCRRHPAQRRRRSSPGELRQAGADPDGQRTAGPDA